MGASSNLTSAKTNESSPITMPSSTPNLERDAQEELVM